MKKGVVIGLLSLACGIASAQEYVGAGLGPSRVNLNCSGATSCDDNDVGYKVYYGYKFTSHVGGEIGYTSMGKVKANYAGAVKELEATAFTGAVTLRGQLASQLAGVVRLGAASVKTALSADGNDHAQTKLKPYLGLGLELALTQELRAILAADFTQGEYDGQTANVRLFSIGLQYDF